MRYTVFKHFFSRSYSVKFSFQLIIRSFASSFKRINCVRHCWRQNFLSNPRRIHSGEKDEEKEEWGLPGALICFSPASAPSPFSPHTARLLHCLGLHYQVWLRGGSPLPTVPPPCSHGQKLVIFRKSGWKGGRPLFRDPKVMQLNSDSFCDSIQTWMEVRGHLWADFYFTQKKGSK
jgi:hypothetical protein